MHPESKKARILRATLRLITENGFHGTPVSMIARMADVGAGTIYRYFANKEAMINELYNQLQQSLHEATLKDIPPGVGVREEFFLKWRNILRYFLDHSDEAKFLEQYAASPFLSPALLAEVQRRNTHLAELRLRGIETGVIRPVDYHVLVVFMWGTVQQLHTLQSSGTIQVTDAVIDQIFEVFWEGIRVHGAGSEPVEA